MEELKSKIIECGNEKTKSRSLKNKSTNEIKKRQKRNDASPPLSDHLRATICGRRIDIESIQDHLCVRVQELLIDLDRRDWLFDTIEQTPGSSFVQHRGVTLQAAISHDSDGQPFLLSRWLECFHDSPPRAWYLFARGLPAIEAVSCEIDRQWADHEKGRNPTFRAYSHCA